MNPSFSLVVNTLNRAQLLQKTLASFRQLRYNGAFEVIVVNGPSTDETAALIEAWSPDIRSARCPVPNLSVSRNIGICMARGDIVAFIDDDAMPEPEWLQQLATAYADPAMGAAGGMVLDHTGHAFQCRYCVVDRFAQADLTPPGPSPHLCFPRSFRFPHLMGTNASFRRSALLEVGGFDEEYEYFLDETDLCLRIVDAGYLIAQLPDAFVHHKFAPSHSRGANRIARHRFPIIKNQLYFMLRHARDYAPMEQLMQKHRDLVERHRGELVWAVKEGLVPADDLDRFGLDTERALELGLARGLEGERPQDKIDAGKIERWTGAFLPFPTLPHSHALTITLVSRFLAPEQVGGIAVFTRDLSRALARLGHQVHVITEGAEFDRVDLEQGVWVHRIVNRPRALSAAALALQVPQHLWDWSASALDEVRQIALRRKIDVVEAPVWDCEGVAFLFDAAWPLVTSLHTTLHFWLASNPDHLEDKAWMKAQGEPMLKLEAQLMRGASAVRAQSRAIVRDIEVAYGFTFDPERVTPVPHGIEQRDCGTQAGTTPVAPLTVLFVGRLEHRKGIDTLLEAMPAVLSQMPEVRFRILGEDRASEPDGHRYQDQFMASESGRRWAGQVSFEGRVDDEALLAAYAGADVFVAPSRYESFGLVFLEAMREGKPVIGCDVGGIPEVVLSGVNGLLVQPGDAQGLARALLELLRSPALRERMGAAGRQRFEAHFTSDQMARASLSIYQCASSLWRAPE